MRAKRYKTVPITNIYLATWETLNAYLMTLTDVKVCEDLLAHELAGRARRVFTNRIAGRIAMLQRKELKEAINKVIKDATEQNTSSRG